MNRRTAARRSALGLAALALLAPLTPAHAAAPGSLRAAVTSVSMSISDLTPNAAQTVTVTGRVRPVAATTVQLQRRRGDVWVRVTQGDSGSDGRYSLTLPTRLYIGSARYRVVAGGVASTRATVDVNGAGSPASYKLFARTPGYTYAHWNPCGTISYRINTAGAPDTAVAEVQGAIRRVTVQTGVRFSYAGTTTSAPATPQGTYPGGTQLVFTWPRAGLGGGGVAGYGSFSSISTRDVDGASVMETVRGLVELDRSVYGRLAAGYGTGPVTGLQGTRQQLLMHEVGHVMGLDHSLSQRQLMYPSMSRKRAIWGDGDAAGLTRLGVTRFACIAAGDSHARTSGTPAGEPRREVTRGRS